MSFFEEWYDSLDDFLEAVQQGKAKRSLRWFGDLYCNVCGEPWDVVGVRLALRGERHADMTREEATRFRRGEGPLHEVDAFIGKRKLEVS